MERICKDKREKCCELFIGTDNVLLDRAVFEVLDSLERDTLTEVLIDIDNKIKQYNTSLVFRTRMVNKGKGAEVYIGYNIKEGNTFRTLVGDELITIKEVGDEIKFNVDLSNVPNKQDFNFQNIGEGVEVLDNSYKNGDIFNASFRKIRSGDFSATVDSNKSVVINYTTPDREAISELKTFNFIDYVEIVRNARRLANS